MPTLEILNYECKQNLKDDFAKYNMDFKHIPPEEHSWLSLCRALHQLNSPTMTPANTVSPTLIVLAMPMMPVVSRPKLPLIAPPLKVPILHCNHGTHLQFALLLQHNLSSVGKIFNPTKLGPKPLISFSRPEQTFAFFTISNLNKLSTISIAVIFWTSEVRIVILHNYFVSQHLSVASRKGLDWYQLSRTHFVLVLRCWTCLHHNT